MVKVTHSVSLDRKDALELICTWLIQLLQVLKIPVWFFEFIKKNTYFCCEGNLICTSISYKASIRHYSMRWYDNLVNSTHYSVHAWVSNKTYLEASLLEIWSRCMTGKKRGCFTDKYFKIFTFRAFNLFAILFNTVVRRSQERIQQVWLWKC